MSATEAKAAIVGDRCHVAEGPKGDIRADAIRPIGAAEMVT